LFNLSKKNSIDIGFVSLTNFQMLNILIIHSSSSFNHLEYLAWDKKIDKTAWIIRAWCKRLKSIYATLKSLHRFFFYDLEITATSRIHVKSEALHISQPCKPVSIFLSGHFPVGKRQHQL